MCSQRPAGGFLWLGSELLPARAVGTTNKVGRSAFCVGGPVAELGHGVANFIAFEFTVGSEGALNLLVKCQNTFRFKF